MLIRFVLCHDVEHWSAVGDGERAVEVVMNFGSGVDSEQVIDRCCQVACCDRVAIREGSVSVRSSVDGSAFHSAAGHQHSVAFWPVVSADVLVDFWSSTELAHPQYEGFVQQSAFFEIVEQNGERVIGDREMVRWQNFEHSGVVETVRVPATCGLAASTNTSSEVVSHKFNARFNEPTGQQTTLSVSRAAVGLSKWLRFFRQVEGFSD